MVVRREIASDRLAPIVEELARTIGSHGLPTGKEGDPALLRVTVEHHVRRIVQVYWTPFEANVPGRSIGLHLEVAEPRVHWAEAYISPEHRNWVFCFAEREDGDVQLMYHRDYAEPRDAIHGFFNLASWYVLTATDKKWEDVTYTVADDVPWTAYHSAVGGEWTASAVRESLKKSTIVWLKWSANGTQRTMPVWFVYDTKADKLYVLSGERQQMIEGAERLREAVVVLRWKGKNAQIAEVPAWVRPIAGDSPDWQEVAEKVAEKRLNIPGLPEDTARRWREQCVILELTLRT